MRVRELYFHNFRSFRGERRISFVDPLLGVVRPITVLAGSNGSGKTTILETIYGLLEFVAAPSKENELVNEILATGFVCLTLELCASTDPKAAPQAPRCLHVAVGREELAPDKYEQLWPNLLSRVKNHGGTQDFMTGEAKKEQLLADLPRTESPKNHLPIGGLLYFPHNRQLLSEPGGPIQPPPLMKQGLYRYSSANKWLGSLEQLWVWQNYLDLEQRYRQENGQQGPSNLQPFIEMVENVLGEGRKITIQQGRAMVTLAALPNGSKSSGLDHRLGQVRLDQLPSGEQQSLLLFGEIARRLRKKSVLMIDEVENSLHPTLQRLVMWNLKNLTREWDMQLIVATHSLEIIQTVRQDAFINLDYLEEAGETL